MEDIGRIEIRVTGHVGNEPLSPENFDIREIGSLFEIVETLLYPNSKQSRAPITYLLEEGSVRNIFKTTMQAAATFATILSIVNKTGSLDYLDYPTARAFQKVQQYAIKSDFSYEFGIPNSDAPRLVISRNTAFHINENLWADVEFYFYGTVINAGGKDKTNIHLVTKDYGTLIIDTPKEILQDRKENILYKYFTIRAKGRQNISTRELDPSSLVLIEMTQFDPNYNEQYLTGLIKKASPRWEGIGDPDKWIEKIRGVNG